MVVDVTDASFEKEVVESALPVLLDLYAVWCRPCQMVAPIVEGLAEEYGGRFKFCRINVDQNPETANKYGVMSIPTLIFFKGGQAIETVVGAVPERALVAKIDEILK